MTIRQQVQEEAQKAAAKIREAVEQFTQATGLELSIHIDYVTARQLCNPVEELHVVDVELSAGGVRAHA